MPEPHDPRIEVIEPYVDCNHPLAPDLGGEVDDAEPELLAAVAATGLRLVSRAAWGARPARASASRLASTRGVKVHYTGGYVAPELLSDHRRCAPAVRAIQRMHMDDNGWNDIGYTGVACPHRYVFVGRGPHSLPASNGPGLNSAHYGVCALVGNRGVTTPVDDQLHALRDAIEWLREDGDAGDEIRGHRDGYSTDCPGDPLYAWVKKGAPRPDEEDDMPLTNDDVEKIFQTDGIIDNPVPDSSNPKVRAAWLLTDTNQRLRRIEELLEKPAGADTAAIVQGVLAGLPPAAIGAAVAAALPPEMAKQVVDEINNRLQA